MKKINEQLYNYFYELIQRLKGPNYDWEWDRIMTFDTDSEDSMQQKLDGFTSSNFLPSITCDEFRSIVNDVRDYLELGEDTVVHIPAATIPMANDHDYSLNTMIGSAWMAYKKRLIDNKFSPEAIKNITDSAYSILNKLSLDTQASGPIKGLVVGNVQSGKTANMAGLIAMAADQGFNMFIVLSGTIENLRIQTQTRLFDDLKGATNVAWVSIDNVSTSPTYDQALSKLSLGDEFKQRYLTVCLKNSTRLENLLTWLKKDLKARKKLKILLIDDEADQASINTAKQASSLTEEEKKERTKINRMISNILINKDADNEVVETQFCALNYIGYTATPYANVLNEKPGPESIYPSNFVCCLPVSKSYIGPQHIFGIEGTNVDGMDIINNIEDADIKEIKDVYGGKTKMPEKLEQALIWFYCCLAIRRHQGVNKPVSMLIHTSQAQPHHEKMAILIRKWFANLDAFSFLEKCEKVYEKETSQFTLSDFKNSYSNYDGGTIQNYPQFSDIANELLKIFNGGLVSILINSEGDAEYSEGVHLCIDNCSHSFIENDNEHIRLLYPSDKNPVPFATGFIVIGGATLSRGLTIEGLVSTFFLRTSKQADTLMQMGRWFGYRKGYELLPRIWITPNARKQFKFLSLLDYELRQKMKYMEENGIKPELVGIQIKRHPCKAFLDVTAKNKQQAATLTEVDFSGITTQTTIFFGAIETIKSNLSTTDTFIKNLGTPISKNELEQKHANSEGALLWLNVDSDKVVDYITSLSFPKNDSSVLDLNLFKKWFGKISSENKMTNWNVVVAGLDKNNAKTRMLGGHKVCLVNRSQIDNGHNDGKIRIGALRAVKELYVDIDLETKSLTDYDKAQIKSGSSERYKEIRKNAGYDKTPLLIIYVIDQNSQPRKAEKNNKHRKPLGLKEDLVGITICIPQGDSVNNGMYISIDMSDNEIIDSGDIEDGN